MLVPELSRTHPQAPRWYRYGPQIWLVCPKGHPAQLTDHEINEDGLVTPSCICPEPGCEWHESGVRLESWTL